MRAPFVTLAALQAAAALRQLQCLDERDADAGHVEQTRTAALEHDALRLGIRLRENRDVRAAHETAKGLDRGELRKARRAASCSGVRCCAVATNP
jgi:hypothetical protein